MNHLFCLAALTLFTGCGLLGGKEETTDTSGGVDTTPSEDVYQRFCERADECNMLSGTSVDECSAEYQSCTDALLPSDADDWETNIEACLEESSCKGFLDCYNMVPNC